MTSNGPTGPESGDVLERPSRDYADLSRSVRGAGLLDRRRGYYVARIALTLAALAASWAVFALVGDSWWQVAVAVLLAVTTTQVAFLGHDAGHKQVFTGRRANDVLGFANAGLVGISFGWWIGKHNLHHANPNHEDADPDLDISLLAFTVGQGRSKRGLVRWTTKYQAFLFFPLLLLEGLNLHWSSVAAVFGGRTRRGALETALLVGHVVAYLAAVFLVLSPVTAIVFIAVHQGLWGLYMGLSFAPNHKGMPSPTGDPSPDFLRRQVVPSRNIRGGPWVDLALGGLNYQIEHHLFPSMPRPNLRRAQPLVRAFCAERGIPYQECGILRSYGDVLRHLHAVGAPLRAATR
jgi:fatty acid desaturase